MNTDYEFETDELDIAAEFAGDEEFSRFRRLPTRALSPRPQPRPIPRRRPPASARRVYLVAPESTGASEYVRWVQTMLNQALNLQLPVDGVMSVQTRSAIRSFQEQRGLPVTGVVGPDSERALQSSGSPAATERSATTAPPEPSTTTAPPASGEIESFESALLETGQGESNLRGDTFAVLPTGASGSFKGWVWPLPVWNERKPVISQEFKPGADRNWGMIHAGVDLMYVRRAEEPAKQPEGIRSANPKRPGFFVPSDRIPVFAVADGLVVASGPNWYQGSFLGHYVIINHGNGYYTFYQHLTAKGLPSKSTRVNAGTPIGIVGHGDRTPLNHLHFEIWPGGVKKRAIDPATVLSGVASRATVLPTVPIAPATTRASAIEMIQRAIQKGIRDENHLTDMAFQALHPELQGRRLGADERTLIQEWLSIRDGSVRPALGSSSTRKTPANASWVHILVPLLNKYRGDIPLDYLLGWIAVESGGQLGSTTTLDERGYFQIHPDESKMLRPPIDHSRLSQDPDYSVQAGIRVVRYYENRTQALGIDYGTDLFWHITKLWHWLPTGIKVIMEDMQKHGFKPSTWNDFKDYVLGDQQRLQRIIGLIKSRSGRRDLPPKWHPKVGIDFVDKLFKRGQDLAATLVNP